MYTAIIDALVPTPCSEFITPQVVSQWSFALMAPLKGLIGARGKGFSLSLPGCCMCRILSAFQSAFPRI